MNSKYKKYTEARKFAQTIKAEDLENGVTINPFTDEVIVSHKEFPHLGVSCFTALGLKRAINKIAKQVINL